jgi:hypothetical protein
MNLSIVKGLRDARPVAYSLTGRGTYAPAAIEVLDNIAGINTSR